MLFRRGEREAIEAGMVTMTVRAWRRPQARVGGEYRLDPRGVIVVEDVTTLAAEELTEDDATACGYERLDDLLRQLGPLGPSGGPERDIEGLTRVRFRYEPRADPRRELASRHELGESEVATLLDRLAAMDRRSKHGPWTLATLRAIERQPRVVSSTLAAQLGRETRPFKADVRKLKNLGLTISHDAGYELSPRGRALLERRSAAGTNEG